MKKILFIGDVHGDFNSYFQLLSQHEYDLSIQLGDMGIGFPSTQETFNTIFPVSSKQNKFIRGNHDNPSVCRNHENYLGDYGVTKEGLFYISGASSIDRQWRTAGVDWWYEEELSVWQLDDMIDLYKNILPKIVISHTPPAEIIQKMFNISDNEKKVLIPTSKTTTAFTEMLNIHKPEYWIFAHMHHSFNENINITQFIGLNILQHYLMEI